MRFTKIWESSSEKILRIEIDNSLKFHKHVIGLCKKSSRKLTALTRLSKVLSSHKMRILMKSFFDSQFSYCPLIWMFISCSTNHKINKLHERSLRILYKDDISSFNELLQNDNSVTVHTRNIQLLAVEMYKVKNYLSSNYIIKMFPKSNSSYNLRNTNEFKRPMVNTVFRGTETLSNIGPQIWDLPPLGR